MSDIFDVVSCFKKIKTKNLGQNKDNLINYLSKDYGYSKESANKVIEKAVKGNVVRIVLFNGNNSYRIVENGENTMIVPETQLNDTQLNDADTTEAISEERNALTHMLNDEIISTLEKKFETFSESIESRLLNIEEQIIDARDRHIEKRGDDNSDNAFCLNLLKNRISELERQIIEKDAIINFLDNQLVSKNLNGDSRVKKIVNDHNYSFQERVHNIVNNLNLVQHNDNIKKKVKASS